MTKYSDTRKTDLPWRFLGRRTKPLALAASIGVGAVIMGPFTTDGPHEVFDFHGPLGVAMSIVAVVVFVAFWAGWWLKRGILEQWALLGTVGVFVSRAALGFIGVGFVHPAPWISLSMAVGAGGAYLLERADHE